MSIKPIVILSNEMVWLRHHAGTVVLRRVIKPQPPNGYEFAGFNVLGGVEFWGDICHCEEIEVPWEIDDILWVKERFDEIKIGYGGYFRPSGCFYYQADGDVRPEPWRGERWCKAREMPRRAARYFLRVKNIGVKKGWFKCGKRRWEWEIEAEQCGKPKGWNDNA